MRLVILLLTILLMGVGCSVSGPLGFPSEDEAQELFVQGLEEMTSKRTSPSWKELERLYPQSAWSDRASKLLRIYSEQEKRIKALQLDKNRCLREREALEQEVHQLRQDMEKLKKLVIDLERRSK